MAFGPDGDRLSQAARCVAHARHYHLKSRQATEIGDRLVATIHDHWDEVCDIAETSSADKERLWGRQFLNPYVIEGYRS